MGSGKSTVGPLLADRLDCRFIDLDRAIERKVECTIAELIACEGEDFFRRIETETLREVARHGRSVIAPGGGAVTRAENRELMSRAGAVVWLDAPFELCWRRIEEDQAVRPLAPNQETARGRYLERLTLYRQAGLQIEVSENDSPDKIVRAIIAAVSTE